MSRETAGFTSSEQPTPRLSTHGAHRPSIISANLTTFADALESTKNTYARAGNSANTGVGRGGRDTNMESPLGPTAAGFHRHPTRRHLKKWRQRSSASSIGMSVPRQQPTVLGRRSKLDRRSSEKNPSANVLAGSSASHAGRVGVVRWFREDSGGSPLIHDMHREIFVRAFEERCLEVCERKALPHGMAVGA